MMKCKGCDKFFLPSVEEETLNIKKEPKIEPEDDVGGNNTTKNEEVKIKVEPEDDVGGNNTTKDEEVKIKVETEDGDVKPTVKTEKQRKDLEGIKIKKEKNQANAHPKEEATNAPEVDKKGAEGKGKRRAEEKSRKRAREDRPSNENPQREEVKDCGPSSSKKGRGSIDWYGIELFKSGLEQPNNPYFVTKKRKNRSGELYIPSEFMKVYSLELPDAIKLIDSKERQFHVTRKTWSDGRALYTGGLKALCKVNLVKDDDSIICEFVNNGSDLCIRVTIVKSNEQR